MILRIWRVTLFQCRFSSHFGLWTLANKQIAPQAHALNDSNHHTVLSNNHPFLFSSKTCDAVLNSLSLLVLVNDFCIFLLTLLNAPTLPRCMLRYKKCTPLTLCWLLFDHITKKVYVWYNLFGLFAYSSVNFGCQTFGASLIPRRNSAIMCLSQNVKIHFEMGFNV